MAVAKSLEVISRSDSIFNRVKEQFPSYLSDARENPLWLVMFIFARTMLGRRLHRAFDSPARVDAARISSLFDTSAVDIIAALKDAGLFVGLSLNATLTDEIQRFAAATPCFGNQDRQAAYTPAQHVARNDPHVLSAHYFEQITNCPAVMKIQQDPLLHTVAKGYLGRQARVISTRLWWNFPAEQAKSTQPELADRDVLHFDLDDWRMLKFFFYLTPVDAASGPHLYVRGSHRNHALKHQLSLTVGRPAEEVLDVYGLDQLVSVQGEPGLGFVEDSFGYHAGALAKTKPRLMLEIGFGVTQPNRRRFYGERVLN